MNNLLSNKSSKSNRDLIKNHKKKIKQCKLYKKTINQHANIIRAQNKHLSEDAIQNKITSHLKGKPLSEWHATYDSIISESKLVIANIENTKKEERTLMLKKIQPILIIIFILLFISVTPVFIKNIVDSYDTITGNIITNVTMGELSTPGGKHSYYKTRILVEEKDNTPLGKTVNYKVLNEKPIDVAYIVASPSVELSVNYNDVAMPIGKIGSTKNFVKEWNSGFMVPVKEKLESVGLETDLNIIYPEYLVPEVGEELVIYEYTHPQNEWVNIEAFMPDNDVKILFLDPAGSWWNNSWDYKQLMTVTNNKNINYSSKPLLIELNDTIVGSNFDWSDNSSLRFTYYNKSSDSEMNIPYWIESWDNINNRSNIYVNSTYIPASNNFIVPGENGIAYIVMYYGNPSATSESDMNSVYGVTDFTATYNSTLGAPFCSQELISCDGDSSLYNCIANYGTNEPNAPNTIDACLDSTSSGTCVVDNPGGADESVESLYVEGLNGTINSEDTINITMTVYCYDDTDRVGIFYTNSTSSTNWVQLTASNLACDLGGRGYKNFSITKTVANNSGYHAVRGVIWYGNDIVSDCPGGTWNDKDDLAFYVADYNSFTISYDQEYNSGYINTTITYPYSGMNLTRLSSFTLNATINCARGDCGNITSQLEYYSVTTPTQNWKEDSQNDFKTHNLSNNISIRDGYFRLAANTSYDIWWDSDWEYRFFFNITNNDKSINDYYIKLLLNNTNTPTNFVWNDNSSLRFIINNTQTNYQILSWNDSSQIAELLVYMPYLSNITDNILYLYYDETETTKDTVVYWYPNLTASYSSTYDAPYCDYFTNKCVANSTLLECNYGQGTSELNAPNTIDSCLPTGTTGNCHVDAGTDESVENITIVSLNDTLIKVGDTLRVSATFYCYGATDRVGFFYTNSTSSINWQQLTSASLSCSAQGFETFNQDFVLEDNSKFQAVRAMIRYGADITDACPADDYTDEDDLVFKVAPKKNINYKNNSYEKLIYLTSGKYVSNIFDTGSSNAQLETVTWGSQNNANTSVKVYVRSSEDNITWSSWFQEVNDTAIDAEDNRYVQYKVELLTTNINQTSVFNYNNIVYKISSLGWKPIGVGESFTGNANYSCGFLNSTNQICDINYLITPATVGNFALRVNAETIASDKETFNISYDVFSNTYITNFNVDPIIAVANDSVTLSARLLNDKSQPMIGYNIIFGDETNNSILGINLTNAQGYAYFTFIIPDIYDVMDHDLNASYPGNLTKYYNPSNKATTTLAISSTPKLIDQIASPNITGIGQPVILSINATDTVGINKVWVDVTTPKGSKSTNFLTPIGDIYSYSYNNTWETGTYTFKISANNSDGIVIDPPGNFTIVANGTLIVDPEKTSYQNFETVYVSPRRQAGWWNSSWLYRDSITIQGTNELLSEYQVDFSFDTSTLISQGKLNNDCSDLRFVTEKNYYKLPIDITNNLGYLINDSSIKISIQDDAITSHMLADGSDLRIFTSSVEDPYSRVSDLPFYFAGIQGSRAEIWIKLTLPDFDSTRVYLYYGRPDMETQSNYSSVFDKIIGYSGKTSASSNWNLTTFPINFTQPVVIGSTNTINGVAESDLRVVNVTTGNVSFKTQESVTLDDVHTSEDIGYIVLESGNWILGGTEIMVNKSNIDNAAGNSYHTIDYGTTLNGNVAFFGQVQTMNETDPVSIRVDTAGTSSSYLKLEETQSDTPHDFEWVGYLAIPQGLYDVGTGYLQVGNVVVTHIGASISYTGSITDPLFISKIQTENGGDNAHERIDNTGPTVAVEEVEAADGAHTTETMAWIAADEGIIYGALKSGTPTITVGSETIAGSDVNVLDYYLENCNQTNSSIMLQVTELIANENTTISYYYGNPFAMSVSDYYETLLYDSPQTIGYVVSNDLASATLDVYSLVDNNSVSAGSSSSTLNKRDTLSVSGLSMGSSIKVTGPVQADSSTETTDTIVPSVFAGTEFIYRARRYTDEIHLLSPWGDANVTVYDNNNSVWTGVVDDSGYVVTNDITDANIFRVVSDIPILAHHLGTNGDTFSLYPATSKPLYGVPGNYLTIGAGLNGASVTGYLSDGSTTSYTLGSNGSYAGNVGGGDGNGPAYKLVTSAIDEIIGAIQQADSDGGEATTFLPAEQMSILFGAYRSADHIAIAALNENTNCTVYNNTGAVVGSSLSSGTINVSKIGFGTGNDNQYVGSNWIMECNDSVWAYYDEESKQDETALLTWPQMRQYHYPEPVVVSTSNEEENGYTGLSNTGITNITGYLYLAVQYNNQGSWQTLTPPVYQDITPITIEPDEILNISQIWRDSGAWSTGTRVPGTYRIYSALRDYSGKILENSLGEQFLDISEFEIILALLKLNNLTHENKYEVSLDEYEVGDLIDWINITIQARNNTAINAEINLTLTNSTGSYPGWGPNSGQSCGNINPDDYCSKIWNNNSNGYLIPEDLSSGSYTFNWQVNATADNGNDLNNNSFTIDIHNIKETFSSSLNPVRIYTTGDPTYYNFSMTNLWSTSLNNINITLNYPLDAILNISCVGGSGNICFNSSLASDTQLNRSFSIRANDSSIPGDYYLNVTVNYTNPRELRSWKKILPLLIEVRLQGILAITLNDVPTIITRGESHNLSVYINNTAILQANNPYINFTLPTGWQNLTSTLISNGTLQPNNIFWNNLTINTTTSTPKGHVQLLVESKSDEGQYDFKYFYVDVYANTLINATHNDTNVSRDEVVKIIGRLLYDDGSPVVGGSLSFYDETDAVSYGSSLTNASGHAVKNIYIPLTASLGNHIINITYSGSAITYSNPSEDITTINVGLKPIFNSLWASPNTQGPGGNVTVYANITDDDILTNVTLEIILPNTTSYTFDMNYIAGLYQYKFNNTWANGTYDYIITAYDNVGSKQINSSSFNIEFNAFIIFNTTKLNYGQNEYVNLTSHNGGWWNDKNWSYKQFINLSHNATYDQEHAYIEFIIDTDYLISNSKLQNDCGDLRIYNDAQPVTFAITNCDNQNTTITIIDDFILNQNITYELFYGSSSVVNGVNVSKSSLFNGTAFVLSDTLITSTLELAALYDETNLCLYNGTTTCLILNESDTTSFSLIDETTYINFNKQVESGFTYTGTGDSMTPLGFAGRYFAYPDPRGQPDIAIYSPYASANVKAYNNLGSKVVDFNLSKGGYNEFSYAFTLNEGFTIESNVSILVHYEDSSSNYDFMPLRPITNELYGLLGSTNNYDQLSCFYDNTGIDVYYSNGTIRSFVCDQGDAIQLGAGGAQGIGPAVYIISNITSIGGMQVADSDGGEGEVMLPLDDLGESYVIPQDAEYISIVPITSSTTCTLYSNTGSVLDSQTSTSYSSPRPQNVIRFTGTPIPAGSRLVCDYPVYAYYEYNDENAETNLFADQTFMNKPYELIMSNSSEFTKGSLISNIGESDIYGYLHIVVEDNVSGYWQTKEVLLNDSILKNLRTIAQGSALDISSVWPGWNTGNNPSGYYRVNISLLNDDGDYLFTTTTPSTMINSISLFNISPPDILLNISLIKIYDVTNNLNKHIYSGDLTASGINKTFILESGKEYRIEFTVDSLTGSDPWIINNSNVSHTNLNSSWINDPNNDIWYKNNSDISERTGGIWNGSIIWNTSKNGVANSDSTTTFYYLLNLTDTKAEEKQVTFIIDDALFHLEEQSIFRILVPDTTAPKLYNVSNNLVYNISNTTIIRGSDVNVYARWLEEINNATIEYNSTVYSTQTDNIVLSSPNDQNWTNHTLSTTSLWLLGNHVAKIEVSDLLDNWNTTLNYLDFYVYGIAKLSQGSVSNSTPKIGDYITLNCKVVDTTDSGQSINNYEVNFYNGSELIGTNFSMVTGWAKYTFIDNTPGIEQITCNISDDLNNYYYADSLYQYQASITTTEQIEPEYNFQSGPTLVHKGEYVTLSTYWQDNYLLDTAILATNASGSYENTSGLFLNGSTDWANFSYQIPITMDVGILGWYQWANDSSNNFNITSILTIDVWGWSSINDMILSPSNIKLTNTTNILCEVIDQNSTVPLENYLVTFYNGSGIIGTNNTNNTGWAHLSYVDNSLGQEEISCVITDNASMQYNVSYFNESRTLNTVAGSDIFSPVIINNHYGLNDTSLYKGGSLLIYSEWNESINSSYVLMNSTSHSIVQYDVSSPYTNNWVNYTIQTNNSWLVGRHVAKIVATDQNGNVNNTLSYYSFNLFGTSSINWLSPTTDQNSDSTSIICEVLEEENNQPISGYLVYFYNDTGGLLGTQNTNSSGQSKIIVDTSSYDGSYDFSCKIFSAPTKYYYIGTNNQDIQTLYYDVSEPNITLEAPQNLVTLTSTNVLFNITVTDDRDNLLDCNLTLDGSVIESFTATDGLRKSIQKIIGVNYHHWNVTCIDDLGNQGYSLNYEFNISIPDSEGPNISLNSPDELVQGPNINFSYEVTDESTILNCSLYINNIFNSSDDSITQGTNSFLVNNIVDGSYDWSIICYDEALNMGSSSDLSFTSDSAAPSAFNIVSPLNFTITKNLSAILSWTKSTDNNFNNYTIQLSLNKNFNNIVATYYSFDQNSLTVPVTFVANNTYYWRVIAYDDLGQYTLSDDVFSYITDYKNPVINLIKPGLYAYEPDGNITFTYSVSDYALDNCSLYTNVSGWSIESTNTSPIIGNNYFEINGLPENTTIIWNVFCVDSVGNSAFSINRTLYVGVEEYYNNITIPVNLTVNNSAPSIDSIIMSSPVNLLAGTQTNVNCSANISDKNTDVIFVNGTLYSLGNQGVADDNNYHYTNTSCDCSAINITTQECICGFNLEYYADAGNWVCNITATDSKEYSTSVLGITINSLRALVVQEQEIDYGDLSGGQTSNESNITVVNLGNIDIDLSLFSYGSSIGDSNAMVCDNGVIGADKQHFALNSGVSYAIMNIVSGDPSSRTPVNINLTQQTEDLTNSSANIFWRLEVPQSSQGSCTGSLVVQAEVNT